MLRTTKKIGKSVKIVRIFTNPIEENKYPIIPILVIDHISKPFIDQNVAAIGTVIHKAYESIGVDNLQIFMFDDDRCNGDLYDEHDGICRRGRRDR